MGSKPHILILAPFFPPFKGAAASRVHSFAKYWNPLTKVTVIAPEHTSGEGGYQRITFPLTKLRSDFLRIPLTFPKLLRLVRRLNPDVIFASIPTVWPLLEGSFLAKRLGRPLILDIRDLLESTYPLSDISIWRLVLNSILYRISRYLIPKASRIVTVTNWFQKELTKIPGCANKQIYLIQNGSDEGFLKEQIPRQKRFDLIYVGTLIKVRDPQALLIYLRHLVEIYPSLRILFVSDILDTSIGKIFLAEIMRLGLDKNVVIKRMVPSHELPALLGLARLGLTSFRPGAYAFRGVVGAKDYEYLASGLSIMGLLDPDFYIETRRLIADNGAGILDPSPERLAIETAALLKDPARLRRMSKQARKVGERFDRKRLAEEYYYKVILPAWQEFNAGRRTSQ